MWTERNGKTWRIRELVAGDKVTLAHGYPSKTAANAAMVLLKADALRGQALVPQGGRVPLGDFLDAWQPSWEASLKPSSAHSEPARIRNHIQPLLGHLALEDIDHLTVQRWVAALQRGERRADDPAKWARRPLAPKTVRNCHGLLHKILQAAVRAKLVPANPCAQTALPARVHHEMRFLTEPEIGRLVAAMPPHWRPLVLLLVSTGLRWGEAIGLRAANLDVLSTPPKLVVLEQLQETPAGELIVVSPKSAMSRRTVTFTAKVADVLLALVAGRDRRERVFRAPAGGDVRTRNFRRTWLKVLKRAGLEGLRIHDLRHTHAAMLISAGTPLTAIQRRLGHSSIAVTSDLYGHLLPQVDEAILVAVEAALALVDPAVLAAEIADELAELR